MRVGLSHLAGAALWFVVPLVPAAPTWLGTVERVSDGDTLWVVREDDPGRRVKLRLAEVDAPESCQPWGAQATEAMQARVQGRRVLVQPLGRDTYRRVLARVNVEGEDLGAWLVQHGQRSQRARHLRFGLDARPHGSGSPPPGRSPLRSPVHRRAWLAGGTF